MSRDKPEGSQQSANNVGSRSCSDMDNNLRQREVSPRRGRGDNDVNNISSGDGDCFGQLSSSEETSNTSCSQNNNVGAVSNLCSATLGAGALSLPFAISLTGIVFGILLLILSAYLTIVSIDIIIESCKKTGLYKYEDVTVRLAGRRAGRVLEISLLIFCFGTAVAYICAVGDILDQGLHAIPYLWNNEDSLFVSMYSREHIMILFWILVMFPLSLQRNVESLERFSSLGVLSIIFLVIASVIHSITHGVVLSEDTQTDISSMLWPDSLWNLFQAFPIIIFAFSCQVNVCAIYEELTPNTHVSTNDTVSKQQIMSGITRKGVMLCMSLYICIGLFGYLDFSHATTDNILNDYCIRITHDPLMITASVFVCVAVVVAFPFNILPARVTLKLILERMKRRRRCARCYRFFSSITCNNCLWSLSPTVHADTSTGSPPNNDHVDVTDPLLISSSNDRFGNEPSLIPHMSLEGMPIEGNEEEVYSTESSTLEHFLLTLLLSGSALVVALVIPGISVIFGLMGGTAASIISFILPGLFVMDDRRKALPYLFVVGGAFIGFFSTWITIYGLMRSNDTVPSVPCSI